MKDKRRSLALILAAAALAACDAGLPASLKVTGTPGVHLPLGYVFSGSGRDSGFLSEYLDIETIRGKLGAANAVDDGSSASVVTSGDSPRIWNYVYQNIAVESGKIINGEDAVQTYLIEYPVAEIPVPGALPPNWAVPEIKFSGPSFQAMLGALAGIQFQYMYCYMLVSGITNDAGNPARISLISGSIEFLQSVDLLPATFSGETDTPDTFTTAILGASTGGFSLIPAFESESGSAPMEIVIGNAVPAAGGAIKIKLLIVLPLSFEIPSVDAAGNSTAITIGGERYVKMDVKQLDDLGGDFDLTEFGNTIKSASFTVGGIKNTVFSGMFLAFSNTTDSAGARIWEPHLIDLDEGTANTPVDISEITRLPKMCLITGVHSDGKGYLSIPPVKRDAGGGITNTFDFHVTLDASTDFSQSIKLQ